MLSAAGLLVVLWLAVGCEAERFHVNSSKTFVNLHHTFNVEYLDNAELNGFIAEDWVQWGSYRARAKFGCVTHSKGRDWESADGIVGLGFPEDYTGQHAPLPLFWALSHSPSKEGENLLPVRIFTLLLSDTAGEVVLGGFDPLSIEGKIATIPVMPSTIVSGVPVFSHYSVNVQSLLLGGDQLLQFSQPSGGMQAILDSGTSCIVLPDDTFGGRLKDSPYGYVCDLCRTFPCHLLVLPLPVARLTPKSQFVREGPRAPKPADPHRHYRRPGYRHPVPRLHCERTNLRHEDEKLAHRISIRRHFLQACGGHPRHARRAAPGGANRQAQPSIFRDGQVGSHRWHRSFTCRQSPHFENLCASSRVGANAAQGGQDFQPAAFCFRRGAIGRFCSLLRSHPFDIFELLHLFRSNFCWLAPPVRHSRHCGHWQQRVRHLLRGPRRYEHRSGKWLCGWCMLDLTLSQLILLVCAITLGVAAVALFIYSFFEEDNAEYQQLDPRDEFPSSDNI
jgi:hypothetical protein